jgi:hypothetical protein
MFVAMADPSCDSEFLHDTGEDSTWWSGGTSNILGTKLQSKLRGGRSASRVRHALNESEPGAMSVSAEALYKMSDVELLAAYGEARRQFLEKRFARDTHRARLAWIRAKMFIGSSGGVTERNMAIDVSEEIARKGQEVREMTRDLDLLKVDVDSIAIVIRFRGASPPAGTQGDDALEGEPEREGH